MARKNVEKYYTNIRQEGTSGATRGKVSGAMAKAMGAKDGDVIEWEVVGGDCVGGRVLSKAERREHLREQGTPKKTAPAKKTAKPTKSVAKPAKPTKSGTTTSKPSKTTKKPSKSSNRKTKVSYDEPTRPSKGKKTPSKKGKWSI